MRESRRLRWILAPYLIVVTLIVGYNAHAIAQQRGSAVVVNVAARQRALSERYTKDVILRTQGIAADPQDDAEQLRANADALLHGGEVTAVQGADATVVLHGADDRLVIAKLDEEQRLIAKLLDAGDQLLPMSPATPGYATRLQELRVLGGQVNSISNDAVGQITRDAEAAFARLVAIGIGSGCARRDRGGRDGPPAAPHGRDPGRAVPFAGAQRDGPDHRGRRVGRDPLPEPVRRTGPRQIRRGAARDQLPGTRSTPPTAPTSTPCSGSSRRRRAPSRRPSTGSGTSTAPGGTSRASSRTAWTIRTSAGWC